MNHRRASILVLVAATLLIFSACRKATFEENYRQGLVEMKNGKYERARVRLRRAQLQSPNNIETKYQLALVELKLKDPRGAFSLLHEAEEKDRKESSVSVPIRIELAKLYFGGRRYDEAQRRLLWVLQKQPHNKEARSLLSVDLVYLDEPVAARQQVDLLLAEDPENRNGRAVDVALHVVNREAQAAEASLLEEVNLTHRSADSLMTLARFYRLLGAPGRALPLLQEVLQHDPKNIPLRLQLGWSYAQVGDSANAEKTFRAVAQVAPADRTAVMALANYYLNLGDWPKAIAELERLIKQSPDANSRDLLAAAYYRVGRQADAQKLALQLIHENSHDTNAHMLNGVIGLSQREYDLAATEFDQVLHYAADSAPATYFLALASYGAGKEQVAQQQMERALNLKKELLPARLWLIDYHLKRGSNSVAFDLARAAPGRQANAPEIVILTALCAPTAPLDHNQQAELRDALLQRPLMIQAYQNLGMFTLLRKYGAALREPLEAVAQKHPDLRPVQDLLTTILEAEGKQDQIVAQVQKKLAAHPNSSPDLLMLAKIQIKKRDFKAARANLEKALALEPGNPMLLAWMAGLELDASNLDAALARLDDLTKRYPMSSLGFAFKAIVYERRKQPKEARALYEQALKLDSHDAVAANNLAWLLLTPPFQEPQEALELARTAHRLDPSSPTFADTLGWVLYLLGNYSEAMESLGDAVRLKPDDARFRYHLGMAQSRAGRSKEAVAMLKTALILNPQMPEAPQVREELVSLNKLAARAGAAR